MEKLLELKELSKSFSGNCVLNKISLTLKPGEVHALVGENGAGKSTLIKCISGIYIPDSGELYVKGQQQRFTNPLQALQAGIAVIHQELTPIRERSVMENIWLGREPRKGLVIDKKRMYADTEKLLDELEISVRPSDIMKNLSIAQIQMIEIAKAVSSHANIVVMDEPTSSLTTNEVTQLFKIIGQLKENNTGIIYVSHKMDEIFEIADTITVLRDGEYISTSKTQDTNIKQIIQHMVGRELSDLFPKKNTPQEEVVLEVEHYTDEKWFKDVSFTLHKGEILGMAGLAGAGRTEVMEAVFGIREKTGTLKMYGKELHIHTPHQAVEQGIILLTEDRRKTGIIPMLSVGYNILMANFKQYKNKMGMLKKEKMNEDIKTSMSKLNVKAFSSDERIENLSGGNQQKALVARWLLTDPEVLILDEPTRGIDVGAKSEIYSIISQLASEGKSIIMISSELPEILGMSDRIVIMHEGRVTGTLDAKDCTQELLMKYATGNITDEKECGADEE
ncbi:sugar ABC transporter ATP-binding protein [Faecalicatena acetigenes]|uniref:Ribose/galactose/methyl galactoside import ATP-binding protein n=1 Tax=Faecalicatena acetigenes TaxID=2981790 RepID=A0ABT2T8L9_9FIRM|nr:MULTISPECIES: sugar ABC transporter ATP-binding protein [Lachnospiraceae]MCU6746262.1 sugar ABC transporter ATP-binding protein [Faecalicatena acetigenes]SCH04194.1 Galactose/methyl galactoside import ATP-binding protein MglA [uncultured Clostridium sp.]